MFKSFRLLLLVSLMSITALAAIPNNPVLTPLNQQIDFANLKAEHITEATKEITQNTETALQKVYSIQKEKRTYYNTLLAIDDLFNDISKVEGFVNLMVNVHPDEAIREASKQSIVAIAKLRTDLSMDDKLYKAVKEYATSREAQTLAPNRKKFLNQTILDFERSGLKFPADKQAQLKAIRDKLSELTLNFSSNIAEYKDSLVLDEKDMDGLPEDYKKAHVTANGKYVIDLSYPSYIPFMRYAKSEQARKELYMKYANLASDKNLSVLKDILYNRKVMSYLLGYQSYAQYALETRMAKTPQNVWAFEHELAAKLKGKAIDDYNELLEIKRKETNDPSASVIQPWENAYYRNILLKDKYSLDQEKIKEYFSVDDVINGLFKISQHLFNVEFREVENPAVWQNEVRLFEVLDKGKPVARFYFDLYPRDNKFNHAACFPIISGKMMNGGYQMPAAALVCNFPRATEGKPALMPHSEVSTFFHEFGHVLHTLLTSAELNSQAGFAVALDFVEAPSQIFENWTWNYDALSLFAKHYSTKEVLPREQFDKMLAAKNVGSGLAALGQSFYGQLDMTLHDKFNTKGTETTTDVVRNLTNSVLLTPYVEGTHMEAGFGHLTDYAAGYYSYLWAEVFAQDMFSVFEKNGVMDQATGQKFKEIILSKGSSEDEMDLVKRFLNREPDQTAFLKSLGL